MFEGKNNKKAWLYLLPVLILLGIFSFYPIFKTFIVAFIRDYRPEWEIFMRNIDRNQAKGLSFFTLENFVTVFREERFFVSIKNTLSIAFISVPISLLVSLVVAVLLVSVKKLRGLFQTIFFLPYVTSSMAIAMAFTVLFVDTGTNANIVAGPVNTIVQVVGLEKPLISLFDKLEWNYEGKDLWNEYCFVDEKTGEFSQELLDDEYEYSNEKANGMSKEDYYQSRISNEEKKYVYEHNFESKGRIVWIGNGSTYHTKLFILLLYSIWAGLAFKILVFTGGLTGIDKQYYDAAKIDGTSKWRTFWRITVPMVSPLIVYLLTTSFIGSFKTYTSVVGLFGDEEARTGDMVTFVSIIYDYIKTGNTKVHVASAASLILFAIIFTITKVLNKLTEKKVHY